jgi:hypothetical protein
MYESHAGGDFNYVLSRRISILSQSAWETIVEVQNKWNIDLSCSHAPDFVVWSLVSVNMIITSVTICEVCMPSRKHDL